MNLTILKFIILNFLPMTLYEDALSINSAIDAKIRNFNVK
jgi:hypothetical protein